MSRIPRPLQLSAYRELNRILAFSADGDRRPILAVLYHRSEGRSLDETARELKVSRRTVATWLAKYEAAGVAGLRPPIRGHRKGVISANEMGAVLGKALQSRKRLSVAQVRELLSDWVGRKVSEAAARYWRKKAIQTQPQGCHVSSNQTTGSRGHTARE